MPAAARSSRFAQALCLAIIVGALVVRAATPPAVVAASAPPTTFSAERAMQHVRAIARVPHASGTVANDSVRAYIVRELGRLGVQATIQDATGVGTRYRSAGRVQNILGRIPGLSPDGRAVMLVSHYDSQGAAPGAGDAASAAAALLEAVRALQAGEPLQHDVIVLITDGEEAGLLGAAAFAREHPWASDVDMILNFEARGTAGRVFMFETGAGNLDAARVLRRVPDVSATSLMVMVYRLLPNDTDLSELMILERPAMNFAFIDGVERYHTAHDDVAHLDVRSVQHHGTQALALARAFGDGLLPRPATGDAVFFDAPFIGLVVYPEWLALPLALVAAALAAGAIVLGRRRERYPVRDMAVGLAGALVAVAAGVGAAIALGWFIGTLHRATGWGGAAEWRGVYWAAVVAMAFAVATGAWAVARRVASAGGVHAGAIIVWTVLTLVVTTAATGASYLLSWPLLAVSAALVLTHRLRGDLSVTLVTLLGAAVVLVVLVPVIYLLGDALGTALPGAAAAGLLTALGAWLLGERIETMSANRWYVPAGAAAACVALLATGAATVRFDGDHPERFNEVRQTTLQPGDATTLPVATIIADSVAGEFRLLGIRVLAPPGALAVRVSTAAAVVAAEVDGRAIGTDRYRRAADGWDMSYVAPAPSGFLVTLAVPAGDTVALELTARMAGVDSAARGVVRRTSEHAVPSQQGDVTLVRRLQRL